MGNKKPTTGTEPDPDISGTKARGHIRQKRGSPPSRLTAVFVYHAGGMSEEGSVNQHGVGEPSSMPCTLTGLHMIFQQRRVLLLNSIQ